MKLKENLKVIYSNESLFVQKKMLYVNVARRISSIMMLIVGAGYSYLDRSIVPNGAILFGGFLIAFFLLPPLLLRKKLSLVTGILIFLINILVAIVGYLAVDANTPERPFITLLICTSVSYAAVLIATKPYHIYLSSFLGFSAGVLSFYRAVQLQAEVQLSLFAYAHVYVFVNALLGVIISKSIIDLLAESQGKEERSSRINSELDSIMMRYQDKFTTLDTNLTDTSSEILDDIEHATGMMNANSESLKVFVKDLVDFKNNMTKMDTINRANQSQIEKLDEVVHLTSSTVEQMVATLNNNIENSLSRQEDLKQLVGHSEDTEEKIKKLSQKMGELKEAAKEITAITEVLNSIANKTNILSINASIEAAHSGEAGEGFAVVANEVRNLAQTSSDRNKEIKQRLYRNDERLDETVGINVETQSSFDRIHEEISKTVNATSLMIEGLKEMGVGTEQMTITVENLETISVQTLAQSRELTDLLLSSGTNFEEVEEVLEAFKINFSSLQEQFPKIVAGAEQVKEVREKNHETLADFIGEIETLKREDFFKNT